MGYVLAIMIFSVCSAPIKEAGCLSADGVKAQSMHIRQCMYDIASCIDFLKATCFRLDKAFSKASLRLLHSNLVSTKSVHSFVHVAGFEVESTQSLCCYSPEVECLSSASVEFRIKKSWFTLDDITCFQEIGGVGFSCFFKPSTSVLGRRVLATMYFC